MSSLRSFATRRVRGSLSKNTAGCSSTACSCRARWVTSSRKRGAWPRARCGCIPIVEKRWAIDYYRGLFGGDPFLRVGSWREAGRLMRDLAASPNELLRLQQTMIAWWADTKARTKRDLTAFMRGPSHAADLQAFSRRLRIRTPALHEPLRLIELIRHQSAGSLAQRLANPRKILARIRRDSGRAAE